VDIRRLRSCDEVARGPASPRRSGALRRVAGLGRIRPGRTRSHPHPGAPSRRNARRSGDPRSAPRRHPHPAGLHRHRRQPVPATRHHRHPRLPGRRDRPAPGTPRHAPRTTDL